MGVAKVALFSCYLTLKIRQTFVESIVGMLYDKQVVGHNNYYCTIIFNRIIL